MIEVIVESPGWKKAGCTAGLKRAAALALARTGRDAAKLSLLLTGDAKLRALNRRFRGRDKPTNVLSFPANSPDYLGDIAIAYGVTAAEAAGQGKSLKHHAMHLAVHGVLHLLGYDHERDRDARRMESLEIDILTELGIADPYRTIMAARSHV